MAILKVARLGHPVLRRAAEPLTIEKIRSSRIQKLIDDMIETMREYSGVGLAAPQVHESCQIAVMEVKRNERYPDAPEIPLTVCVNPKMSILGSEMDEDWEGCLSVIDLRGKVPRYRRIRVEAYDREGGTLDFIAEGFLARVIQHECDHLIGKVFLDRMRDLTSLSYLTEYLRYGDNTQSAGDL